VNHLKCLPALLLTTLLFHPVGILSKSQSLSEFAQKEAERRKNLEQNGVEGKVIEDHIPSHLAPKGNLSTPSPSTPTKPTSPEPKLKTRLQTFRNALQKYDREIRRGDERLRLLRSRFDAEKWALPKVGKISSKNDSSSSQDRLKAQIQDLELKLAQLRRERLETYDSGRKAGFLPGEMDGKGIIP
jgi:hypothetical protein